LFTHALTIARLKASRYIGEESRRATFSNNRAALHSRTIAPRYTLEQSPSATFAKNRAAP